MTCSCLIIFMIEISFLICSPMLFARIFALSRILIATPRPDSVSVAYFTLPNVPWPSVLPRIYFPTFLAVAFDSLEEEEDVLVPFVLGVFCAPCCGELRGF